MTPLSSIMKVNPKVKGKKKERTKRGGVESAANRKKRYVAEADAETAADLRPVKRTKNRGVREVATDEPLKQDRSTAQKKIKALRKKLGRVRSAFNHRSIGATSSHESSLVL